MTGTRYPSIRSAIRMATVSLSVIGLSFLAPACGDDAAETTTGTGPDSCAMDGAEEACFDGDDAQIGVGTCRPGSRACTQGVWGSCDGQVAPIEEVCGDDLDNDCDGIADEGCPCSGGTRDCYSGPGATRRIGTCTDGQQVCVAGAWSATCQGEVLPGEEVCGAVDDDGDENCNGIVDDSCPCTDGASRPCYGGPDSTRGLGECQDGLLTCTNGSWPTTCEGDILPSAEVCDRLDNDCNGALDDDASLAGIAVAIDTNIGDCQIDQCDGAGGVTSEELASDTPDDGNNCTFGVCTGTMASHEPSMQGEPCGTNGVCNGSGQCTGCNTAGDCGTDTACSAWACTAGVCEQSFSPDGTVAPGGAAGDCSQNQCDGAGAVVARVLASDTPNDGNQCTDDVCSNGTPSNPNRAANVACTQGGGRFCDGAGTCVDCNAVGQCSGNSCENIACTNNACSTSNKPINTACNEGGGNYCTSGSCVECTAANQCSTTNQCRNATCSSNNCGTSNKANGTACTQSGGNVCSSGNCVECIVPSTCGLPANQCQQSTCNSNNCGLGNRANGTLCNQLGGNYCKSGNCRECSSNVHCSGFQDKCDNGGNCVECLNAGDCPPIRPMCLGGMCEGFQ